MLIPLSWHCYKNFHFMIIFWPFVTVVSGNPEKAQVAIISCGAGWYSVLTGHILSEPQNLDADPILAVQLS